MDWVRGTVKQRRHGVRRLLRGSTRFLLLSFILLGLATSVSASSIESQTEVVDLGDPTEVTIHINYSDFTANRVSTLIQSSHEPRNLRGYDSQGEIACEVRQVDVVKEILCEPTQDNGAYNVTITYTTPNPGDFRPGYRHMEHIYRVLENTGSYTLRVVLPEGYGTVDGDVVDPYVPESAVTGSEGRRIFIEWTNDSLTIGDRLVFTLNYQELEVFEDIFPGFYAAVFAAAVIFLAAVLYWYVRRRSEEDTIASLMPVLKEDERAVLRYMIESEGECEQKELVRNLPYSKAKVSRLVKDLEERNLVEKIKEGRKNRLVLKKEIGDIEVGD